MKPRLDAQRLVATCTLLQIAHERDERIDRLAGKVDRVLVDAPCSGLGTLRRNPGPEVAPDAGIRCRACAAQQIAILNSAARLLKPGGRLVYATCSLLEMPKIESVAHTNFQHGSIARASSRVPALTALQVHARVAWRTRIWSIGDLPATVAAPPWHRRFFRRSVATHLICIEIALIFREVRCMNAR